MRYAIVSDLHANLPAWQTVLTDIADLKADKIICLGDVVGYGPNPAEVLESVYRVVDVTLQGNHDAAVSGILSTATFSARAASAVASHKERLTTAALEWLMQLPLTHAESDFNCAHGDFSSPPDFHYIVEPKDALPSLQTASEQLLFVGHSHLPGIYVIGASGIPHFVHPCDFELEEGKRYIVNPGSVGYPRVGDCRSSYCLYDDAAHAITFRQLPFDSAGYRQAMQGAGLDDDPWIAEKERQQHLRTLREKPAFAKPRPSVQACPPPRELPSNRSAPQRASPPKIRLMHAGLMATACVLMIVAGVAAFRAGRTTVSPELAIVVPPFDLPSRAAYPLTPPDKNLLPPLPTDLNPEGRLEGWRYAFEDRSKQTFSVGLRDGATTLRITNLGTCKVQLESPLINLAGTDINAVRLRGKIRKSEAFSGTAFYQLILYTTEKDGQQTQAKIESFEVRGSRRKDATLSAAVNRKITLSKKTTHVRFRIEAAFAGILEISQPSLSDDKGVRP